MFGVDPIWLVINVAVLLLSLSVHEAAHAWSADRLGDDTARLLGRVTVNPLSHIDLFGTVIFPILGLLAGGVIFGWAKPVPVNPRKLANPRLEHALIAGAGPASNIVLAIGFVFAAKVMGGLGWASPLSAFYPLWVFCQAGVLLNIVLAVFNVLPIPPLDGSWILESLLPSPANQVIASVRPYGFLLLVLLLYSGWLSHVLLPVVGFARQLAL